MRKVQVGIDLGTTNTLACCRVKGKMKLLKFKGGTMLPSAMYVEEQTDGSIKEIVGKAAKMKGLGDPDNYISSSKTYIGLTGKNRRVWTCHKKNYTPTDVATKILEEVHRRVRELYDLEDSDVVQAVITIPAYFTSTQSDETKRAGERAGMEVLRIITEPVAAALAAAEDVQGKIFVVDLGGGTFDVSVLDIEEKYRTLEIGGERRLGGDDFDDILVNYFLKDIGDDLSMDLSSLEASGLDYTNYYVLLAQIRKAAIEVKERLSDSEEAEVDLPDLFEYGNHQMYSYQTEISRNEFNNLCQPLFKRILGVIDDTVKKSSKFKVNELKKIFLVGGSCYIPRIQEMVEEYFGMVSDSEQDRATLVAMGAGKIADAWDGFTSEEDRTDPFDDMLQDIISHDMGIEVRGVHGEREFSSILSEGSNYPCKIKKDYTTIRDNQDTVVIKVYEKTVSNASDFLDKDEAVYDFYGSFELTGITPAPAGQTRIEVTFDYDESRTLSVTAEDPKNHVCQTVELHKGETVCENTSVMPMDFYLLIDVSGSMYGKKIEEAKKACTKLVQETLDLSTHRLGIIAFDSTVKQLCGLTKNKDELMNAVAGLRNGGSTNMSGAIRMAYKELLPSKNKKAMIIVTDGEPDSPADTNSAAKKAHDSAISIATIGVAGADRAYLRRLSDDNSLNFSVDNLEKLSDIFGQAVENLLRK